MKTAYFVLGMHRSGTSALSGILKSLGLECGTELMQADQDNPKGYFENMFMYRLNEKILQDSNSSWDDCNFNIASIDENNKAAYIEEAKSILESEFKYSNKFLLKDPRLCLLFPVWEYACRELGIQIKIVLPYRNPFEIAKSLKKRNKFSIEKSLLLWANYFYSGEYYSRQYERIFIDFDSLVRVTDQQITRISDFLGIAQSNQENISEFIESDLKHNNISYDNIKDSLPPFIYEAIALMKHAKLDETSFETFNKLKEQYDAMVDIFYNLDVLQNLESVKIVLNTNSELLNKLEYFEQKNYQMILDEDYYLTRYVDVKMANNSPLLHFVKYGFYEGRCPNLYCEIYNIQGNEISDIDRKHVEELEAARGTAAESERIRTMQAEELEQKGQLIDGLQVQKAELEELYGRKNGEIEALNRSFDELVNDMANMKEESILQKAELEGRLSETFQKLRETEDMRSQLVEELEAARGTAAESERIRTMQAEELEQKGQLIDGLQVQKAELEELYGRKNGEIEALNRSFDELVNDMANMKEESILQKAELEGRLSETFQKLRETEDMRSQLVEELEAARGTAAESERIRTMQAEELEQKGQLIDGLQVQKAEIDEELSLTKKMLFESLQNVDTLHDTLKNADNKIHDLVMQNEQLSVEIHEVLSDLIYVKEKNLEHLQELERQRADMGEALESTQRALEESE
ncbi:MAG: hypothetical protein AB7S65_04365, partial [Sulfuricurvum sp.]